MEEPSWVRWRYAVLAGLLLVVVAAQATTARWSGDFWLHAATVEAIADDPLSPANPTQSSDAPSPNVSPYTVAVGVGARLVGADAVTALAAASLALVLAFVLLLPPVVRGLTGNDRAPFWALLATLVLWGADPLRWSGYLSLHSLVLVSPYPAMAAWCCVLAAVWALLRLCDGGSRWRWGAVLAASVGTAIVVHPLTAMAIALALGSVAIGRWEAVPWRTIGVAAAGALALVVAWPAYRVWDLASGGSTIDAFHDALYDDLLARSWPLLLAVPVLVWRARSSWRDPLVLLAASSAGAVAVGWLAGMSTLGRLFPLVGFAAHTAIGDGLGLLEVRPADRPPAGAARVAAWLAVGAVFALGAWNVREGPEIALGWTDDPTVEDVYGFVRPHVRDDDVVLAPPVAAAYLAGLGEGRPVATVWEERLSDDDPDRRADVDRFFEAGATDAERAEILDRWNVDVVVVDRGDPASQSIEAWLLAAGSTALDEREDWSVWRTGP